MANRRFEGKAAPIAAERDGDAPDLTSVNSPMGASLDGAVGILSSGRFDDAS